MVDYDPRTIGWLDPAGLDTDPVSIAAAGANEVIAAPGAGRQLWIYKLVLVVARNQAVDTTLQTGTTDFSGALPFDGMSEDLDWKPLRCGTNEAFNITLSAAVAVTGFVTYRTVVV